MKSCTESAIRSRLRRHGYRLVKHFNGWEEGYMVVDASTNFVDTINSLSAELIHSITARSWIIKCFN